jgi:hypothetical protein
MISGIRVSGLCILVIFFTACNKNKQRKEVIPLAIEDVSSPPERKVRQIFYNMYLPTEMSRIFERSGANYNPSILNSSDNISRYESPNFIALNLGIYGVDMSYAKLFDQAATTARYFSSIQLMSEKLGIPDHYFKDILQAFEKFRDDKDSLTRLAGEIYERTDKYLNENKKESYAALIITGGWIEALYIACRIYQSDPDNMDIVDRIGEQKYSLNTLISLLNNYQDDLFITEKILMLKQLKMSYDKIEIFYNEQSFKVDTVNDLISASDYVIEITPEIVTEIAAIIDDIRSRIVS